MRAILIVFAAAFCAPAAHAETCKASLYKMGRKTANGERFDPDGLTAASLRYGYGARLRVRLGARSVVVRVNDRGPFARGRCLDLSRGAAARIGLDGVALVSVQQVN